MTEDSNLNIANIAYMKSIGYFSPSGEIVCSACGELIGSLDDMECCPFCTEKSTSVAKFLADTALFVQNSCKKKLI